VTILYIAIAGALGSVARYLVATAVQRTTADFPVGTLTVNIVGSLVIGFVMALFAARGELDSRLRIALTIGFLGGFTTYSAFAYETVSLLEEQRVAAAAGYVMLTFAAAAIACFFGIAMARGLAR